MSPRLIATEEAFTTPEILDGWVRRLAEGKVEPGFRKMAETIYAPQAATRVVHDRLTDIGEGRIALMDAAGIDVHILSLTAPGVQVFEPNEAAELAIDANDRLAAAVRKFPTRFAGLAAIAPQAPDAAVREIRRAKKELGLKGLIINSHTYGEYLDLEKFWPILSCAAEEGMPIYLHPREPSPDIVKPYLDYGLYFAGWGFAVETGLHAMRLIMSGVFDRFPDLRIVLGHMGEAIPFWLERIDNRHQLQVKIGAVKDLPKRPSQYFLDHFVITTSGMTSAPALRMCMEVLGPERILFAADFPYEDQKEAADFINNVDISSRDRALIAEENAVRVFNLDARTVHTGKAL